MKEFYRVLKPGGVILMQIPFGAVSRIIIKELLHDFTIVSKSYAIRNKDWMLASEDEAMKMDYCSGLTPCIVRIEAVK
jgi:ubiquinone/menaquinone biosynthesis C-methylase UbiE